MYFSLFVRLLNTHESVYKEYSAVLSFLLKEWTLTGFELMPDLNVCVLLPDCVSITRVM